MCCLPARALLHPKARLAHRAAPGGVHAGHAAPLLLLVKVELQGQAGRAGGVGEHFIDGARSQRPRRAGGASKASGSYCRGRSRHGSTHRLVKIPERGRRAPGNAAYSRCRCSAESAKARTKKGAPGALWLRPPLSGGTQSGAKPLRYLESCGRAGWQGTVETSGKLTTQPLRGLDTIYKTQKHAGVLQVGLPHWQNMTWPRVASANSRLSGFGPG